MRTAQATAAAAVREAAHNRHATPTCATRPRNHGRPALSRRSRRDPRVLPAPPLDHHCAHAPAGVPVQLASTPSTRLVGRLVNVFDTVLQALDGNNAAVDSLAATYYREWGSGSGSQSKQSPAVNSAPPLSSIPKPLPPTPDGKEAHSTPYLVHWEDGGSRTTVMLFPEAKVRGADGTLHAVV
jgi:hypothetical protein